MNMCETEGLKLESFNWLPPYMDVVNKQVNKHIGQVGLVGSWFDRVPIYTAAELSVNTFLAVIASQRGMK